MAARIMYSHGECTTARTADQHPAVDPKPTLETGKVDEAGLLLAQVVEELSAGGKRLNDGTATYDRERVRELVVSLRHVLALLKLYDLTGQSQS